MFKKAKEKVKEFYDKNKLKISILVLVSLWTYIVGSINYEWGRKDMLIEICKKNDVLNF